MQKKFFLQILFFLEKIEFSLKEISFKEFSVVMSQNPNQQSFRCIYMNCSNQRELGNYCRHHHRELFWIFDPRYAGEKSTSHQTKKK
jgi:hypothetical protein